MPKLKRETVNLLDVRVSAPRTNLLRAACLKGDACLNAWKALLDEDATHLLTPGAYRLWPLLYQNLREHDVTGPELESLRAAARLAWLDNTVRTKEVETFLGELRELNIQPIVMKGMALVTLYYGDAVHRPTGDADLLFTRADAMRVVSYLDENRWKPGLGTAAQVKALIQYNCCHAQGFVSEDSRPIDIHWGVLGGCLGDHRNADWWAHRRAISVGNEDAFALSHEDQMLQSIEHGIRTAPDDGTRWVADVLRILDHAADDIDWDRLVIQARLHHIAVGVHAALTLLVEAFWAAIPSDVLDRLARHRLSYADRLVMAEDMHPPELGGLSRRWTRAQLRWLRHRYHAQGSHMARLLSFPGYLRAYYRFGARRADAPAFLLDPHTRTE